MASDTSVENTEVGNPYSVLGVSTNSSHEEIKRAYQRLILKFHPDKLDESLTQEDCDKAYERFLAIDRAWKLLNDKQAKKECDRLIKEQKLSQHWAISAEMDLDDMDYNEDQGSYSTVCRCSGEYLITNNDLENGRNIVCCSDCSFSIRVLYSVIPESPDGEDQVLEDKS